MCAIERDDDPLLTVAEVAERLRLHPITVRRHIKAGRLRAVRAGRAVRVRESEVEALLLKGVTISPEAVRAPLKHEAHGGGQIPGWPPTPEEAERRRRIARAMRRERARLPPLGMSTVDLIRESRRELEDRYRTPPGLDR